MLRPLLRTWRTLRQATPKKDERGTALLMVLLLVAVMSATATAMLDDIRFAVRRSANVNDREQALWYALGAERMARQIIYRSYNDSPTRSTLIEPWAVSELLLPIDGGRIEGAVRDGGNCFNVNAVVQEVGPNEYTPSEENAQLFVRLLTLLDVPPNEAEALADSVIDWMDADEAPHGKGAEDYDYVARTPPRRTANTRFADIQELRAVRGVTPELYRALAPFVCALPDKGDDDKPLRLNINTLQEADAPLIVVAFEERIDLVEAFGLVTERPIDGYASIDAFWDSDTTGRVSVTEKIKSRFEQDTIYYDLTARIFHHGAFVQVSSTLELDEQGELALVRRRYGALE